MKNKMLRFIRSPLKFKLIILSNMGKRILIMLLGYLTEKPLSTLFKTTVGRDLIYSAMPPNQLVLCDTDEGLLYIVNSSDQEIGRYVYRYRKSFDVQHLVQSFNILGLKQQTILLDVGANIGTTGIFAVSQGLVDKCIAFEPEPKNFDLLEKNVQLNGLGGQFVLHNVALSHDNADAITFELSPTNYGDHRVRVGEDQGLYDEVNREVIKVSSDSIDRLLEQEDLQNCVLFMDTQGFEGHVLRGAKHLIACGVPIVTEFWPYGLGRANGIDQFYSAFENSPYTTLYDLKDPNSPIDFSIAALKDIANELGGEGPFTNLLIF